MRPVAFAKIGILFQAQSSGLPDSISLGGNDSPNLIDSHGSCFLFCDWHLVSRTLSHINEDRFCEAVLGAHSVLIPEKLDEAESTFKNCGAISESPFDGLPERNALAGKREDACSGKHLAGRTSVGQVIECRPIKKHDDNVAEFMEIPLEIDLRLMKQIATPGGFQRNPEHQRDKDIGEVAEGAPGEGGEGETFERLEASRLVSLKCAAGLFFHHAIIS